MNGLNNFFWKCTGMFELFSLSVLARIFLTILIELGIVVAEAILYAVFLRKICRKQMTDGTEEGDRKSTGKGTIFVMVLYAIIANVASLLAGFILTVVTR